MTDYDLIVVGAGPGGSHTAKMAAEQGLEVLLVDRKEEIGTPVRCGEGIGKENLQEFYDVEDEWVSAGVSGARVHFPNEERIEMTGENSDGEVGYILERKIFDRDLADKAAEAGANLKVGTEARGLKRMDGRASLELCDRQGDFEVEASIVIGADGVESQVGSWAGLDTSLNVNDVEKCAQYLVTGVDFESDYVHFSIGNEIAPGGYIWMFPKGKERMNLGVVVLPSKADKGPEFYLQNFLSERFPDGEIIEKTYGGNPVEGPKDSVVSDNVMLVGDAARHVDPFTGGGLSNALRGGKFAAEVASKAISESKFDQDFLSQYDELWKERFGGNLERNKKLQEKFLSMDDDDFNSLADSLPDENLQEISLKKLAFSLIKSNPKLLWDLKDFI